MSFVFLLASFFTGQVVSAVRPAVDIESNVVTDMDEDAAVVWPRIRRNAFIQIADGVDINQTLGSQGEGPPTLPAKLESKLHFEQQFGEPGSFGVAYKYKVTCSEDTESPYIALKQIMANKPQEFEEETEALGLMKGKSDYVVSLVGSPATYDRGCSGKPCIVMEFFNKGELFDLMVKDRLTTRDKAIFIWQLVKGLQAMHKEGVIHMDIKPENALVNCNDQCTSCYAAHIDLGLAATGGKRCLGPKGTPPYIAPEAFSGRRGAVCIPANDVWSMGVVIHDLFVGVPSFSPGENERPPFPLMQRKMKGFNAPTDHRILHYVKQEENAEVSAKVLEILSKALVPDHKQRISVNGLLELAAELLQIIAPTDYDRVVNQTPLQYGAKLPAPKCLGVGPPSAAPTSGKAGPEAAAPASGDQVEKPSAKQLGWIARGLKLVGMRVD